MVPDETKPIASRATGRPAIADRLACETKPIGKMGNPETGSRRVAVIGIRRRGGPVVVLRNEPTGLRQ